MFDDRSWPDARVVDPTTIDPGPDYTDSFVPEAQFIWHTDLTAKTVYCRARLCGFGKGKL